MLRDPVMRIAGGWFSSQIFVKSLGHTLDLRGFPQKPPRILLLH